MLTSQPQVAAAGQERSVVKEESGRSTLEFSRRQKAQLFDGRLE